MPGVSLLYAGSLSLTLLAADQLADYMPGAWFELLAAGVLGLALLTLGLLLPVGWRRYREGLRGHLVVTIAASVFTALLGLLAIYGLIENASVSAVLSGADTHLTRPVMDSLPRPPGTRLLDETPGLQGTESISEDIAANNLNSIVPFYERELARLGWAEDKTSATTPILRFTRDDFVLSVGIDPPSSGYTLTLDRLSAAPSATPAPSASPSS
ncbi:MAG TPA: hypothetical protein VHW91_06755 [Candidatus Dormibacteraeota bacterium]|nr:hypothetical protein [Candidatus Dormibacteraeota bacterium]